MMKEKKEPRKFNKAQLEAIRNSPMLVRKREAAEAMFSSPEYKSIARKAVRGKKTPRKTNKN